MKKFKVIYPWEALDEIKEGKTVFMLDRETQTVECVNDMTVDTLAQVLMIGNEKNRFDFWMEEKEDEY